MIGVESQAKLTKNRLKFPNKRLLKIALFVFVSAVQKYLKFGDLTHIDYVVLSRIRLFATPWTVAHQVPLDMVFFRQEYWRVVISCSRGSF